MPTSAMTTNRQSEKLTTRSPLAAILTRCPVFLGTTTAVPRDGEITPPMQTDRTPGVGCSAVLSESTLIRS